MILSYPRSRPFELPILGSLVLAFFQSLELSGAAQPMPLTELMPVAEQQGWGQLQIDCGVGGKPLAIAGRAFARGLGTHANSEIVYELEGEYTNFAAWVGADDFLKDHPEGPKASIVFQVFGDGAKLFDSGVMRIGDAAKPVSVPVGGVDELKLVVTDAGDGINCDHADWAEPVLMGKEAGGGSQGTGVRGQEAAYEVKTAGLVVELDASGHIAGSSLMEIAGRSRLGGCRTTGDVAVTKSGGGYAFTRKVTDAQGHRATVTDRYTPDKDSVRWEVEITSPDAFWTAPIVSRLKCAKPEEKLIWTAWGSPDFSGTQLTPELAALVQAGKASVGGHWSDPLVPVGFLNRTWHYGNVAQGCPVGSDFVALPLFTVLDPGADAGVSLVLSPEDVLLTMDLAVSASGQFQYTRTNHRLGGGKTVKLTMHVVPHEASWRGGLRWMTARYPQFFEAPNPRAHTIAGCGAYSTGELPIDVAKFKKMAFGFNWKLSDDFPYMGMFIPPVKTVDEKWTRSGDERSAAYKGPESSCRQMNDYARYMKTNGFAVLSYFNVTEFGKNMYGRQAVAKADEPDLWKDPVAYLRFKLPNAVFDPGIGTCYKAFISDVGDPGYLRFMLEQADRNTRMLPDTDGICIDRADWLRLYNRKADDGVSWVEGAAARSLFRSWIDLMSKLGPQMHKADKVIFSNLMTVRLELGRELDGIYTEFGNNGNALNASALLGTRKPVVAWTYNETLHQPDPDAFMQRHLHLGAFPTAPYPYNNHCINPEPSADRLYMDYGPLLDAMRGKKWVLAPRCVETTTPGVKVNLFEVPAGYALPVSFGGQAATATVKVRNIPGLDKLKAVALHPGVEIAAPVASTVEEGALTLTIPLKRGCAMVQLTK
jgi:hypothetical protein